jgi:hypothetical protein
MLLRALAIWCGLLMVAFVNGAVRVIWLMPTLGDSAAHLLSALILSTVVIVVTWRAIAWLQPHSANDALLIGDEWVLLTIAFEFLAGYYLFGASWDALLAQYDVSRGEMWVLVLITMLMAPMAAALGHHLIGRHRRISSPRKARFRG